MTDQVQAWIQAARDLGAEHATSAATWITDGNDTDDSRRAKLRTIENDGIGAVICAPNLSYEWADDLSPHRLYGEITGRSHEDRIAEDEDSDGEIMNALCDAYERGVSEVFEDACVRELRGWLED